MSVRREVRRPIMRYHGGKWKLAEWVIGYFPPHKVYVEPFGGAASILLRKQRSYAEVYNDIDGEIVNVFRMARDRGRELREQLYLTPFARQDFETCYEKTADCLEQARRTIARSFMGFGSAAATQEANRRAGPSTGFRANSNRSGTTPAHDWKNYAECFDMIIERLRGVVIEHRDARQVMEAHDSPQTLHYVDPPYLLGTRDDKRPDYRHELTDEQHIELAEFLRGLRGSVIVSGYQDPLYDRLYAGWKCYTKAALADGARKRVECVWLSPSTTPVQGELEG